MLDNSANQVMAGASSSFAEHLQRSRPELLPYNALSAGSGAPAGLTAGHLPGNGSALAGVPHATTIVALTYAGEILMAWDWRNDGQQIASRHIERGFPADHYSVLGIAGTAGIAIDITRLFQVELEHYEKIEGTQLSLDGKANRLGAMVRGNLPMAMQGLAVVPLFAGFDRTAGIGRLFSYDVTGGRYEEQEHHAVGSGSVFARGALKKLWRPGLSGDDAVQVAVEALYDAADDDSATGGPDPVRQLWPVVYTVDRAGAVRVPEAQLAAVAGGIIDARTAAQREA